MGHSTVIYIGSATERKKERDVVCGSARHKCKYETLRYSTVTNTFVPTVESSLFCRMFSDKK